MAPPRPLAAAIALVVLTIACGKPPADPLRLEGNVLTVHNGTSQDWTGVEIWLNTYYRETTPLIQAGGVFRAPLDVFVEGFGRRFDFRRAQVKDLRLTAKHADGTLVELKMPFKEPGLSGAANAVGEKGRTQ